MTKKVFSLSMLGISALIPMLGCMSIQSIEEPQTTDPMTMSIERLGEEDESVAKEAIRYLVAQGESALPALTELRDDPDPRVRARAQLALSKITGQWGGGAGIIWTRSLEEATKQDKPILLLHLFGNFDEEFC